MTDKPTFGRVPELIDITTWDDLAAGRRREVRGVVYSVEPCVHDEVDEEGTCLACGMFHARD